MISGAAAYGSSNSTVSISANNNAVVAISSAGASQGQVSVTGQLTSNVYDAGSGTSLNFDYGNVQTTSHNCSTGITLSNMRDGGAYTVVVTDTTGTATCAFTHTGLTFRFMPANDLRNSGKHTVYTFVRVGTIVYVSWISGF